MKKFIFEKLFLSMFLTVVIMLGIYTKSNAVPLSEFAGWSLLASEDKIEKDGHIGPGNGGQLFDAEYLFYKYNPSTKKLSLGLQTGFDVIDGNVVYEGHNYYAGDLALSFGGPLTYAVDFGLFTRDYVNGEKVGNNRATTGIDAAGLYNVSSWNNDVNGGYSITQPFAMESGSLVTGLIDNYAGSGYNPVTSDAFYYYGGSNINTTSYFRVVSFDASSLFNGSLSAHWTMSCGNDDINGTVPEPGTMFLLGSLATGLFGFAGLRRRFIK